MPTTLNEILAAHRSLLVLDTAAATTQVGWFTTGGEPRWAKSDEEAGVGIFKALAHLGVRPGAAGALAYCEGPGSILGIRSAAVALTVWRARRDPAEAPPIFTYRSLELLAATVAPPGLTLIADARRQSWHALDVAANCTWGAIERRTHAAIAAAATTRALALPGGFRTWTPLPVPAEQIATLPYDVATLWAHPRAAGAALWREVAAPDAFQHEEPGYATWTPAVHRAPTAEARS